MKDAMGYIWDELNKEIAARRSVEQTVRSQEKVGEAYGFPISALADAPLAADGMTSHASRFVTDWNAPGYYDPSRDNWQPMANLRRANLFHDHVAVVVGSPLDHQVNSSQPYNLYSRQFAAADGDTFTQAFGLLEGVYDFHVLGVTNGGSGLVDWFLDNTPIAVGQDWYSAGTVFHVTQTVAAVSVVGSAHVLRGVITGQNPASGGYQLNLTKYWFVPSGGD